MVCTSASKAFQLSEGPIWSRESIKREQIAARVLLSFVSSTEVDMTASARRVTSQTRSESGMLHVVDNSRSSVRSAADIDLRAKSHRCHWELPDGMHVRTQSSHNNVNKRNALGTESISRDPKTLDSCSLAMRLRMLLHYKLRTSDAGRRRGTLSNVTCSGYCAIIPEASKSEDSSASG